MSKQIELIQSLSLGFVLAVTVAIGCGSLVGVCYAFYEGFMESRTSTQAYYKYEQLRVLSDGRLLIEVQTYRPQYRVEYLDFHRNPVQLPDEPEWLAGAYLPEKLRIFLNINRRGPQARVITVVRAGLPVDQRQHANEDWYFVFEDKRKGHGYFVAFDIRNRERLGYLGTQGFQNDPLSKAEQFRINGLRIANFRHGFLFTSDGLAFLQSGNKLFRINLKTRTVRLLLGDKNVLSIATFQKPEAGWFYGQPVAEPPLVVRTPNQMLLLDFSGEQRQTIELPTEFPTHELRSYILPNGNVLWVANAGNHRDAGLAYTEYDTELLWTTPQGDVTQRQTLTLRTPRNFQHLSDRAQSCLVSMAVPAPAAGGMMAFVFTPWRDSRLNDKPYTESVSKSLQDTWPALLSLLILAAGLTYLTERRQRKFGLPRSYAWLVFVFLLGLPGYIAYLVHRPWPLTDPPPPPERTGLEVFA